MENGNMVMIKGNSAIIYIYGINPNVKAFNPNGNGINPNVKAFNPNGNSAIINICGASLNADADAFNTNPMNFKIN